MRVCHSLANVSVLSLVTHKYIGIHFYGHALIIPRIPNTSLDSTHLSGPSELRTTTSCLDLRPRLSIFYRNTNILGVIPPSPCGPSSSRAYTHEEIHIQFHGSSRKVPRFQVVSLKRTSRIFKDHRLPSNP